MKIIKRLYDDFMWQLGFTKAKRWFNYLTWVLKGKPVIDYQGFNCGCCGAWVGAKFQLPSYKSCGVWWDTWGLCDKCKSVGYLEKEELKYDE
jgi:hypothetical protein